MSNIKFYSTRFPELFFGNVCKGLWSFFVQNEDGSKSKVGPHYASKIELLCDTDRYATEYGLK